jgi:hypothetical protein
MSGEFSGSKVQMLQEGITARQQELQRVADVLAKAAQKFKRYAAWTRILLIFLGACAATQGTWDEMLGGRQNSTYVFTVMGILISTLAGIEAAFKFEGKGSALSMLAASCHSTVRKTDATWYRQVGIAENVADQVNGAMALMELQDTKLSEIQEKAAGSGVNITLEIRSLHYTEDDGVHPESLAPRGDRPYAA